MFSSAVCASFSLLLFCFLHCFHSLSLSSLSNFLVLLAFLWLVPNLSFLAAAGELQIVKLSMWLIVPRPQINNVETMINGAGIVHLNCCQLWQLLKTPPRVWLEIGKGKSRNCFDCSFQFCRLWLTRGAWPFNWVQPSLPFPSPFYLSLLIFSAWTKHRKSQRIFVFLLTLGKSQKLIWNCLSSFSCFANVCVGEAGKVAAKIKKTEIARVVERQTRAASSKQRCTPWASGQVIRYNLAWFGNSCDGMTLETLESLEQC